MSKPIIEIKKLGKRYRIGAHKEPYLSIRDEVTKFLSPAARRARKNQDEFWALKDVSFSVQEGEAVGIIGRNGAGKSTLLKILSQITPPTEGSITMRGRVASLLEVGTGFHPELTGRENIYLNGTILGMSRADIKRKFDEIVAFAEVEKFLDTPVKRYSSGMYVRLAFAVAAHLEPEILVVDEVLAVGDAQFQNKCLGKMKDVAKKEGRTVVFVSHNMTAIQSLCTSGILLNKGRVIATGNPVDIIAVYFSDLSNKKLNSIPGVFEIDDIGSARSRKVLVKRICFLDHNGLPQDSFQMGKMMTIQIKLAGLSCHNGALIGIIFKNELDQRITSIHSGMSCINIEEPRNINEIARLVVPKIPFMPGTYWIDISIAQPGVCQLEYFDRIVRFSVVEGDVYGTGFQVTQHFGVFFIDAKWEIVKDLG